MTTVHRGCTLRRKAQAIVSFDSPWYPASFPSRRGLGPRQRLTGVSDGDARNSGLGFSPVQYEMYDFIVPVSRASRSGVAAFIALLQQPSTRDALANLGMKP